MQQLVTRRSFGEPGEVQVRLLGPVEVVRGERPIRGFESRKALALLCFLAEHGEPVTRDELVGYFWEDKTEAQGRANLSRVLHNDGTLVPGALKADRYTVQFDRSTCFSVDVAQFDELVRRGDPSSLEAAAALYRGDLMRDLMPEGCPRFETWLMGQQERWRKRATDVLRRLLAIAHEQGQYAKAIGYGMRILDLDPWREDAHREVMLLYALVGERTAALMQYQKCRDVLLDELGVEPGDETTALYSRIRTGMETLQAPKRLPRGEGAHLGSRSPAGDPPQEPLEQVRSRLAHPLCRVLSLVGPAGAGKTHLAGLVAATAHRTFPQGVRFVGLGEAQSAADVLVAMARAIELPAQKPGDLKRRLIYAMREQDMLLVLDGVVDPGGSAEFLDDLLRHTPWLKVLVTTRRPLGLPGEWLFELTDGG